MPTKPIPDDELRRRAELHRSVGTAEAARQLGISESTLRRSAAHATRRNVNGAFLGPAAPEGYQIGRVTSLVSPEGTVLEWQRKEPTVEHVQSVIDDLIAAMAGNIRPVDPVPTGDAVFTERLLTLYPLADVHLGQLSWSEETGENYDLAIAKEQFHEAVDKLMWASPPSETALIVILGDFFHADDSEAVTPKSKHHLDVDGRYDKVLFAGADLAVWAVEAALKRHAHVVVHVSRGNHDTHSSKALAMALYYRYQQEPRVTIDTSPRDLWVYQWGKVLLGFTHGDKVKAEDMPGVMAAQYPTKWGETIWRYAYSGHFHKSKKAVSDEKHGASWEILPAFTAKDAWNAGMGFTGRRELQSVTFDTMSGKLLTNHIIVR